MFGCRPLKTFIPACTPAKAHHPVCLGPAAAGAVFARSARVPSRRLPSRPRPRWSWATWGRCRCLRAGASHPAAQTAACLARRRGVSRPHPGRAARPGSGVGGLRSRPVTSRRLGATPAVRHTRARQPPLARAMASGRPGLGSRGAGASWARGGRRRRHAGRAGAGAASGPPRRVPNRPLDACSQLGPWAPAVPSHLLLLHSAVFGNHLPSRVPPHTARRERPRRTACAPISVRTLKAGPGRNGAPRRDRHASRPGVATTGVRQDSSRTQPGSRSGPGKVA